MATVTVSPPSVVRITLASLDEANYLLENGLDFYGATYFPTETLTPTSIIKEESKKFNRFNRYALKPEIFNLNFPLFTPHFFHSFSFFCSSYFFFTPFYTPLNSVSFCQLAVERNKITRFRFIRTFQIQNRFVGFCLWNETSVRRYGVKVKENLLKGNWLNQQGKVINDSISCRTDWETLNGSCQRRQFTN